MKHLLETIALIIIMAIALSMLMELLEPFVPYMILAAAIVLIGGYSYRRTKDW